MKIKITKKIPVEEKILNQIEIGSIHEVIRTSNKHRPRILFINISNEEVGIIEYQECEVVER